MAARIVLTCDRCGAEPAQTLVIDVGLGPRALDLCGGCQQASGLGQLAALLEEYGAPAEQAGPRMAARAAQPAREWKCPVCGETYGARNTAMGHVQRKHAKTVVESSLLIPPRGRTERCTDCGYLAQAGLGIVKHRQVAHPEQGGDSVETRELVSA